MTPSQTLLEARLLALERQCRRLRMGFVGLGAAVLAACLAAAVAPGPDTVRAREFVLVGPEGKDRGRWSAEAADSTLWLRNAAGTSNVVVSSGRIDATPDPAGGPFEELLQRIPGVPRGATSKPWAGLRAWTTNGFLETASVLLSTPIDDEFALGLEIERGPNDAAILVGEDGTGIHMERGDDPLGVTNIFATSTGCGIDTNWNDERGGYLIADGKESRLRLYLDSQPVVDDDKDQEEGEGHSAQVRDLDWGIRPLVELFASQNAGSVRIHDGDAVIFEKP